jgi:hypothetical protein
MLQVMLFLLELKALLGENRHMETENSAVGPAEVYSDYLAYFTKLQDRRTLSHKALEERLSTHGDAHQDFIHMLNETRDLTKLSRVDFEMWWSSLSSHERAAEQQSFRAVIDGDIETRAFEVRRVFEKARPNRDE